MEHPPGSIIIAANDLSRYSAFTRSLTSLITPPGTKTVWGIGSDICKNFNAALSESVGAWVWIMGDDHVFAPDLLMRLLDHHVDVVSPLVSARKWPFSMFVFRQDPEKDEMTIVDRAELPSGGLHPYDGCSGAGMLIRRAVLEKLTPPYYEPGRIRDGELNEDTWLMYKMRQAGAQIWVDFDLRMGHQTPAVVWPSRNAAGQWEIEVDLNCHIHDTAEVPCR
jgi:Glycosyl transferase family 2